MRIDNGHGIGEASRVPRDQCEQGTAATKQRPHQTQDGRKGMSTQQPCAAQSAKGSSNDSNRHGLHRRLNGRVLRPLPVVPHFKLLLELVPKLQGVVVLDVLPGGQVEVDPICCGGLPSCWGSPRFLVERKEENGMPLALSASVSLSAP